MEPLANKARPMGRPRKPGNRDLPPNLYVKRQHGRLYYQYFKDGKFHGLGCDKDAAIRDAIDLNAALAARRQSRRSDEILSSTGSGLTLAKWIVRYLTIQDGKLADGDIKENTHKSRAYTAKRIEKALGEHPLSALTTKACVQYFESLVADGHPRMAQLSRSILNDILQEALHAGEIATNPVAVTRSPRVKVKRDRLTLEIWKTIYEAVQGPGFDPWLPNAMLLAMLTSHSRAELVEMRFSDVSDGFLHITRKKTGARIAIDTRLRLDAIDVSIEEAIARCRDRVLSRFLIHHTVDRGNSRPGASVHVETISKGFARARVVAGIRGEHPPTFYEQRSLSERLYRAQGLDTQALLGHKDPRTTALYNDSRGTEWIRIEAT